MASVCETGLFRQVLEEPFDKGLRLIYADFLEDTDRPTGARFIREQVEHGSSYVDEDLVERWLLNSAPGGWSAIGRCIRDDSHELNRRHHHDGGWASPGGQIYVNFRGGMVEQVSTTQKVFLEVVGELFQKHPITEVRLIDKRPFQNRRRHAFVNVFADADEAVQETWSPFGRATWFCYAGDHHATDHNETAIHKDLADHLQGRTLAQNLNVYEGAEEAVLDLSRACVIYGRKKAKLPALDWKRDKR